MSEMFVKNGVRIRLAELDFQFVRSSGPGGQKVNKTSTCAILSWNFQKSSGISANQKAKISEKAKRRLNSEGNLSFRSDRYRDRSRNIADCIEKLRGFLLEAFTVQKRRVATKPTKASRERRIKDKQKLGEKKRRRSKADY